MKILQIRLERLKMIKESESLRESQENHFVRNFPSSLPINFQTASSLLDPEKITSLSLQHKDKGTDQDQSPQTKLEHSDFKTFSHIHDKLVKLKAKENEILRTYLERKIVNIYLKFCAFLFFFKLIILTSLSACEATF